MNNNKTLYEILGFSKNGYNDNGEKVSFESIERAKNRLLYGEMGSDSVPFWMRDDISKAYSVLSNPTSRKEYDESLLNNSISFSESVDTNDIGVVSHETEGREEVSVEQPVEEEKGDYSNDSDSSSDASSQEPEEEYDEAVVDLDDYSLPAKEEPIKEEATKEEPIKEEPIKEEPIKEDDIIPIQQKEKKENKEKNKPKKELSTFKKVLIYGASIAILGIPGPIVGYLAIKALNGRKLKLHPNKNKKISQIKTQEAKLISEYNEKLDNDINTLLAKPNNNYNLQILKTRYENQVQLLQKRIELKLSEKVEGKSLLKYKLEYIALNNQLNRAKERLEKINKKIEEYNKGDKVKNLLTNSLNERLYEKDKEVKTAQKEDEQFRIKKLNVRKERWQKARDMSAKGLKLTRNAVGRVHDGVVRTFDCVRSVKEIFTPYDEISGYKPTKQTPVETKPEETEENKGKTR